MSAVLLYVFSTLILPITLLAARSFCKHYCYSKEWTDNKGVKHFRGYNCQPKEKDPNHED